MAKTPSTPAGESMYSGKPRAGSSGIPLASSESALDYPEKKPPKTSRKKSSTVSNRNAGNGNKRKSKRGKSGSKRSTKIAAEQKAQSREISDQEEKQDHSEDTERQGGTPSATQIPSSFIAEEGITVWEEHYPHGQLPEDLPPEFDELTNKQKLFVIYYCVTRKGVEAARMAGYAGEYVTLNAIAVENLQKPSILQAYDSYMRPRFERHGVTIERIIQHYADLAFAPWGDYVVVKEKKGRIVQVFMPLSAKVKALEALAKMTRLLGEKDDETGKFIDRSQHIHLHKYTSADEARAALLDFLKHRK